MTTKRKRGYKAVGQNNYFEIAGQTASKFAERIVGAFKDMPDQAVTTFSVSILTKEKENALALRKLWQSGENFANGSCISTTKEQSFRNFSRDKSPNLTTMLRWGVTRSERAFIC